jgi:hypothetical protein
MASLTLRLIKGEPLTNAELDANFSNLDADVASRLLASSNLSDLASAATARTNLGLGNVENKSSATIRSELTSLNVTTALGFTPYDASNPTGYITSAALSPYLTSASAASTYLALAGGTMAGSLTLNAGTANGLAYLNGSKVLTTGSALTFDGALLGVPSIGQSGSGIYGFFNSTGAGNAWASYRYNGSEIGEIGQGSGIISGGSNTDFGIRATNNLVFGISFNEQMRLTSTGLGIGTSSPQTKLQADGTSAGALLNVLTLRNGSAVANSEVGIFFAPTDQTTNIRGAQISAINDGGNNVGLKFYTGAGASITSKMLLDSSGNLGLGVTPSAWQAALGKVIQLGTGGAIVGDSGAGRLRSIANAYFDGSNWRYIVNGYATYMYQDGFTGATSWQQAPSGTAGNAISFTQAMTLDASGRLLVGSTSATSGLASGALQVGSGLSGLTNTGSLVAPTIVTSGSLEFNFDGVSGAQRHGRITGNGTTNGGPYAGGLDFEYYAYDGSSAYRWYTGARITSGGTLCINTTSTTNSAKQVVAAAYQGVGVFSWASRFGADSYTGDGGDYAVIGFGVETSSFSKGAFGWKRTGSYDRGAFVWAINNELNGNSAVATDIKMMLSPAGGLSLGTTVDPGAGAIYATGNITAYYSSDAKFKENVTEIPSAAATVLAIGGKLFDWTDEYIASHGGEDGYFVQKQDFGVIAQDVLRVFPRAVRKRADGSLAVDYEKLSALAFAAIAEQEARINEQQARIDEQEVRIARLERLIEARLQ